MTEMTLKIYVRWKMKVSKTEILKKIIEDTFWMARRYANGRRTYAPMMVREAYNLLKEHFPEITIKKDVVISENKGRGPDYLGDCNE